MIAIIPARSGSKSLPGKNIKPLLGKPLIAYSIEAAKSAESVDEVFVSTDSPEIAEIASKFGASIPFLRPKELAGDKSKAIDVYIHTIEKLKAEYDKTVANFIVLQPTSPLRLSDDINSAIQLFFEKKADSVISVKKAAHPPVWARKITEKGILTDYFPNHDSNLNRQEIEPAYMPNGAIFIFNYRKLKEKYQYYFDKTYPYIMSAETSVDIDSQLDFDIAEFLISQRKRRTELI